MTQQQSKGKSKASEPPAVDDYDDVDWSAYDTITLSDTGKTPPETDPSDEDTTSDDPNTDTQDAHSTDPFLIAEQVALHTQALPASPCQPGCPAAYVIYNGIQMGIFETWYVDILHTDLY